MTIPTNLIENALALTGKTMEEMKETITIEVLKRRTMRVFSIEKFCFYLLSPEFIEKYNTEYCDTINCDKSYTAMSFGIAIYEYQSGNPEPLITLLTKIQGKNGNL